LFAPVDGTPADAGPDIEHDQTLQGVLMRTEAMNSTRPGAILRRITALLSLAALAACADGNGPTDAGGPQVAAVEVTAPAASLAVGETMQLGATARGPGGAAIVGATVTWSSSDASVAAVTAAGLVTAQALGQAVIRATSGGRTGEAVVTVAAPAVASMEITPGGEIDLAANGTVQLRAVARTAAGQVMVGVPVRWSSSNEPVARVTETGTVLAGFGGTATITARAGGTSAQVTVRVRTQVAHVVIRPGGTGMQVGATLRLTARGVTAAGDSLDRQVVWGSENERVATVDAQGTVTAHRPGSALIRATIEGVSGWAQVTVPGAVEHRLERAAGEPLPVQVGTRTVRDAAGAVHEQRVVLTGGVLRLDNGYQQRLTLEIWEGDTRVATEVYEDRGRVMYDMWTGSPIFESTQRPGLVLRAELVMEHGFYTGEMTIAQRIGGEGAEVALRFGKP
jgi:uncharacterized protein YjdB